MSAKGKVPGEEASSWEPLREASKDTCVVTALRALTIDVQLLTKNILSFAHLDSVNFQALGLPSAAQGALSCHWEGMASETLKEPAFVSQELRERRWKLFTEAFPRDTPEPLALVEAVSGY